MSTYDDYHVFLRRPDGRPSVLIDDIGSLTLTPIFNNGGRWVLNLAGASSVSSLVDAGYGVIVIHDDVEEPIFSGSIDTLDESTDDEGRSTLQLSGPDDTGILANLQALPGPPAGEAGTIYGVEYDVESGPGETVLRQYVHNNAISTYPVDRLTLEPDQGRGNSVSERARFGTLLSLCQSVAAHAGGLGFKIIQTSDHQLVFRVYEPADRSGDVVFSRAMGNLTKSGNKTIAPTCNHVIVAGGGEGTARVFYETEDPTSIARWGRITKFVDQRQTVVAAELEQAGQKAMLEGAEQSARSVTPSDVASIHWGRDYQVGDLVRVDPEEGDPYIDVVRQVSVKITPSDGLVVQPIIGSAGAMSPSVPSFFGKLKELTQRVAGIETAQ